MFRNWASVLAISICPLVLAYFPMPAIADSVIAKAQNGTLYASWRENLDLARSAAISNCERDSGGKCTVFAISKPDSSGYAAVAQSEDSGYYAIGYSSLEAAKRLALNGCAQNTPANKVCRITFSYFDSTRSRSQNTAPAPCLNPANGLLIINGICGPGGIDAQGNPWGTNNQNPFPAIAPLNPSF